MSETEEAPRFAPEVTLSERIAALESELSPTERRVTQVLSDRPDQMVYLSAQRIAERARTSDATVVRTARTLGYQGLSDLKQRVGREVSTRTHPATRLANRIREAQLTEGHDLLGRVSLDAVERVEQTLQMISSEQIEAAIDVLNAAHSVFTFGTGISNTAAQYTAKKLARLGVIARHISGMGFDIADDLLQLRKGDCVVIICPGRLFREIEVILAHVERLGLETVLITSGLPVDIRERTTVVLEVAGSPGGLTGEVLGPLVAVDAILLGIAAKDRKRATTASRQLNETRKQINTRDGGVTRYL